MNLPREPGLEAVLATATVKSLVSQIERLCVVVVEQVVGIRGVGLFLVGWIG